MKKHAGPSQIFSLPYEANLRKLRTHLQFENPLAINTCSFGTNEQVLIMGSSANDVGPYSLYILVTLHPYMHPLPLQISSLHT